MHTHIESKALNSVSAEKKEAAKREFIDFVEKYIIPNNPPWFAVAIRTAKGLDRITLKSVAHWDNEFLHCIDEDGTSFKAAWEKIVYIDLPQ